MTSAELRSVRVDPELWRKGLEAARRKGTNRNAVLVKALEELVAADELERAWRDGLGAGATAGEEPAP